MRRVCIGIYFSSNSEELRQTLLQLRSNTPRSAAILLLADGPDPVSTLELRAFSDLLQLSSPACEGRAACFNRLAKASDAELLVFLESGTIVPSGWLERMLLALDADLRNGLVVVDTQESDASPFNGDSPLILVRREVVHMIGTASAEQRERVPWISEYCKKAGGAGFGIASAGVETQHLHFRRSEQNMRPPDDCSGRHFKQKSPMPVPRLVRSRFVPHGIGRNPQANDELDTLTVVGHFNISSGYGAMSEYLVRGMSRAGANVNVAPISVNAEGLSEEFRRILRRSRKILTDRVLFYSWPEPALQSFLSRPELFIYTMWESSRLPSGWVEQLNRARVIIVPSRFVADMFRESGITASIEIVPDGVDPSVYYALERPVKDGLTTIIVGPLDNRKNVRKGIAAWKDAFADDPDARLIIKTQYNYQNYVPDDPRIRYVDMVESTRGILHWYQQADVLLALGSEGFGLPLIEGMATGLPVVALNSEGQADVCRDASGLLLPVSPATWETYHSGFGAFGVHGVPDVPEIAARLRWVKTHREEAREMGQAASTWVLQHRNVWTKGPATLDAIEAHSHSPARLRRATVLWVPSWKSPCGIAEYAAHLQEALPASVKVAAHAPDLRTSRLIHVQHESGIFDQSRVLTLVRQAAQVGVPVVVTEHAVDNHARVWEQEATALVALTTLGVARLKARCPRKRVEYIPVGCPTWFPPRKPTRGRVIGAFGFLAHHKGFWKLLDVLRQVPGTELLLFAYSKSPETESLWENVARSLPVRRIREYLPVTEIARRLAEEADLLAYWYDEVPHYSASAAVRIGLATGVPVLASPTSWFHDLLDVTYQPRSLADGVGQLLDDTKLRDNLSERAHCYCRENSWSRVADQHVTLWNSLMEDR